MTTIGAAWLKSKEKDGQKEYYYTISIDDAVLPITIDNTKKLVLKENKNKGDNDKAPNFYLDIYIPVASKAKTEQPKDPNIQQEQKEDKYIDYFVDETQQTNT